MNRIISLLLGIIFIQFLISLYVKFIYETTVPIVTQKHIISNHQNVNLSPNYTDLQLEALVNASIKEIMHEAKQLPKSNQYTVWDKEMVAHIGKTILLQSPSKSTNKDLNNSKKLTSKKSTLKKNIKKTPATKKVEKFAKAKLGKKYVWGAIGPNQFDCSGFTREVFRCTVGINIPRVSRDQAKVGKYIEYKDLKRGDMVFFDTEKKFTGRVNHVGIYLSNGNFIHASSAKKKVIITSFRKKPFYKKRFLWGRRVLKNH